MRLIDADYVLHKMDITDLQPRTETEHYAFGFAKEILRNAPTIEAEPVKHGTWIRRPDDWFCPYSCCACGEKSEGRYKYCPECGARMDGDTND